MTAVGVAAERGAVRTREVKRPFQFGGLSFIAVGVLFLSKFGLDLLAGPPPSSGAQILAWRDAGEFPLAVGNEVLFFAAGFLIPAVIGLYRYLARVDGIAAAAGYGLLAAVIPTIFVTDIVQGRLVFPAYGLQVDAPAAAELVVALYYGGLHAVGILFGMATALLSIVLRHGAYGRSIALLGMAAALGDVLGAYPETIGPVLIAVCQVLFAAWFVVVGTKLLGAGEPMSEPAVLLSATGVPR